MTQRALMLAALSGKKVRILNPLRCDDSEHLFTLLRQLGADASWEEGGISLEAAKLENPGHALYCGNAGTAMRFGCCLSLVTGGGLTLDGNHRMRQRPIGPLGETLGRLGMDVTYPESPSFPPIVLTPRAIPETQVDLDASVSSQFSSGLLMVAPFLPHGLELRLTGNLVSIPYLDMTLKMMERAGIRVERVGGRILRVPPGGYFDDASDPVLQIEADWSGASFLLAIPLIAGLEVDVPGLLPPGESIQGDAAFSDILIELTREREHQFDLTHTPDLISPLVAAALFRPHRTIIKGAGHTRVKECDRISVLVQEFSRVGFSLRESQDGLEVDSFDPTAIFPGAIELDPHDDHRMAMAFALVSLRIPGIVVKNPHCVRKSFPDFWLELGKVKEVLK
jgi:3-phosphoshikimate 1-carboxyvinyltransferase